MYAQAYQSMKYILIIIRVLAGNIVGSQVVVAGIYIFSHNPFHILFVLSKLHYRSQLLIAGG